MTDCAPLDGETAPAERLFFALWPEERTRAELAKLARKRLRGAGRLVGAENLHLTLYFAGSVDEGGRRALEELGEGYQGDSFSLSLDTLGHFPRPRVAWSGPRVVPPALSALAERLRRGAAERGLPAESRPFHPHVTLARKVARYAGEPEHRPIEWCVAAFSLVKSVTHASGARYVPVKTWALEAPGT